MFRSGKTTIFGLILWAWAVILLASCDRFFGNDSQSREPLALRDQNLSCVRTVASDIDVFFAGGDRDPVKIADCLSGTLKKFAANTRGASPDGWTKGELGSFFETHFRQEADSQRTGQQTRPALPSTSHSRLSRQTGMQEVLSFDSGWVAQAQRRKVVSELFRWKAVLLGGNDQTLSRAEVARILEFLAAIREPLADWRGFGTVLTLQKAATNPSLTQPAAIDRLTKSIRRVIAILASAIETSTGGPAKAALKVPMKVSGVIESLEQAGIDGVAGDDRRELAELVKLLLIGGDRSLISGTEWPVVARQGAEVWIASIRFKFGVLSQPTAYDRDIDLADATLNDLVAVVRTSVERNGGAISLELLRELVGQLGKNKLLPIGLKAKSTADVLPTILSKLLSGNSEPEKQQLVGLTASHIDRVHWILNDWLEGQRIAVAVTGERGYASLEQTKLHMARANTTPIAATEGYKRDARAQMMDLVLRGRPLVEDSKGRLVITPVEKIPGFQRADLEKLNVARIVLSSALRAYAHDKERLGVLPRITESEAQELFNDFKYVGRDLGLVDVRSLEAGVRTFMEANVFMSMSDGDGFISLHEGVEWFSTCMRAGILADKIHLALSQLRYNGESCAVGPPDVFGKNRVRSECFHKLGAEVLTTAMSHLPNVSRALREASREADGGESFLRELEKASRALGDSDLPIESSDFRVMSPILHYDEALFARFDSNNSGHLETAEVWSVFPLIRPFISKVARGVKLFPALEKAIFSWLVLVGQAPPHETVLEKFSVAMHIPMHYVYRESADIEKILQILGSFQSVARNKRNTDLQQYYVSHGASWGESLVKSDRATIEKTRLLLQCTPEAESDLIRLIVARRAEIFAPTEGWLEDTRAKAFTERIKGVVQADAQLQLKCLAF